MMSLPYTVHDVFPFGNILKCLIDELIYRELIFW